MESVSREMTFDEEYTFLKQEAKELFDKEDKESEPPESHNVVRRALRCIKKLVTEVEPYKEYKDLEEQGLLLRLPCKVGTSVYMVAQDCGGNTLDCMRGDCEGCPYLYSFVEENKFETYMCDDIGKTVFLTQEEAEQKLKEMERDCNDKN